MDIFLLVDLFKMHNRISFFCVFSDHNCIHFMSSLVWIYFVTCIFQQVQSKSVPEMAVFRKFKGLNIKYSYRDPKRHFLTRNDVFRRTLRKNPFRGLGCSLIDEPKKTKKKLVTPKARQNHVSGEQKPLNRSIQNFASSAVHDIITHANFGEDRLGGLVWRGVEFWTFPLTCFVAFKTLSHYRASV